MSWLYFPHLIFDSVLSSFLNQLGCDCIVAAILQLRERHIHRELFRKGDYYETLLLHHAALG